VSRTALREALKALAAKGLIESKTKVGTRVLPEKNWNMFDADLMGWRLQLGIDAPFLTRLFEIRLALEPLAAARPTDWVSGLVGFSLRDHVAYSAGGGTRVVDSGQDLASGLA